MRNMNSLSHHLLNISRQIGTSDSGTKVMSTELKSRISKIILPRFHAHKLNPEHILIIAIMFEKTISDSIRMEPLLLLREIYQDPHIVLQKLDLILHLIELRVLDCDNMRYMKVKQKNNETILKLKHSVLMDTNIGFSERFMTFVLGSDDGYFGTKSRPFKHNREYVGLWFKYVDTLYNARTQHCFHYSSDSPDSLYLEATALKKEIDIRLACTRRRFQLPKLAQDYSLSADEQVALMFVLKESLEGQSSSVSELQILLNNTLSIDNSKSNILAERGTLIREGLLIHSEEDVLSFSRSGFEIAPDIAALILGGRQQSDIAIVRDLTKHDSIFSTQLPASSLRNLVLPRDKMDVIHQAISKYKTGGFNLLHEWGLLGSVANISDHNRGEDPVRLRILCYGPPGTGKTALANAIASALRRPILCTDISKILDQWVGGSEKNVSKLFSTYRKICKRTKHSPVLLLDEADQFISARGSATESVDRMYNQIQNIFLENLETFHGILIATTNLIDNIDNAFSRRFDIKMELSIPTLPLRRKLWKKIIPSKLPLSEDVNLDQLARDFIFTGGQIKIVIHNAAVAAATRSGSSRIVRQKDFLKYAKLEQHGSFDKSTRKPIGYL